MASTVELPPELEATILHGKKAGGSLFAIQFKPPGSDSFRITEITYPTRDDASNGVLAYLTSKEEASKEGVPDFEPFLSTLSETHVPAFIDAFLARKFDLDIGQTMKLGLRKRNKQLADPTVLDKRKEPRVWYHDPENGDRKRILKTEVDEYVKKGWKSGRDLDATPGMKWYHRPVKDKKGYTERERIPLYKVAAYVADGYYLGKGSGKTYLPDADAPKDADGTEQSQHNEHTDEVLENMEGSDVGNMDPEPVKTDDNKEMQASA